jgi:hypothetical protein
MRLRLPKDAFLYTIGDRLTIYFTCLDESEIKTYSMVTNTSGFYQDAEDEETVTIRQLASWKLTPEEFLFQVLSIDKERVLWDRIRPEIPLYQYPRNDTNWVRDIVSPRRLIGYSQPRKMPMIMVINEVSVLLSEWKEPKNLEYMYQAATHLANNKEPLTARPLVLDQNWQYWDFLPASENHLEVLFDKRFGKVND